MSGYTVRTRAEIGLIDPPRAAGATATTYGVPRPALAPDRRT